MSSDVLLQNVFNLFIVAIILEASVMVIFSVPMLREMAEDSTPIRSVGDVLIIILALVICWTVPKMTLFYGMRGFYT